MVSKKTEDMFTRRAIARLEKKLASLGRDATMSEDISGIAEVAVRYFGDAAPEYLRQAAECAAALFDSSLDPKEDDEEFSIEEEPIVTSPGESLIDSVTEGRSRKKEEVRPPEDSGEEFVDGSGVTVV